MQSKVEFVSAVAEETYRHVQSFEHNWDDFLDGRECLRIYYEDMLANPEATLGVALEYCELSATSQELTKAVQRKPRTFAMTRPEQDWFIRKLKHHLRLSGRDCTKYYL